MTSQEPGNKGHDSTGFVVKDRRRFDAQGARRDHEPGTLKTSEPLVGGIPPAAAILDRSYQPSHHEGSRPQDAFKELNTRQTTSNAAQQPVLGPVEDEDDDDGDINFSSFVVSLATQASIQLGLLAPPPEMDATVDLEAAKQTIDILGLVERKTRGNLNDEEKNLLVNVLHELRIGYVQIMKSQKKR